MKLHSASKIVSVGFGTGWLCLLLLNLKVLALPIAAGETYFVDCAGGSDDNDGLSSNSPWGTLERVNQTTFAPGDSISLRRGTTCQGMLWPKGSGSDGAPITLGAFGMGPLPVIDGGQGLQALLLESQEYWHLENLDVKGGTKYGVRILGSSKSGTLHHFRLSNLVVHDVYGDKIETKQTGLVVFVAGTSEQATFNDVVIDNVTAYNTNQWAGIEIKGGPWPIKQANPVYSRNVTIRNSTVYNVYGDGIVLWYVANGKIEYCVAHDTGLQPDETVGSPSAIWTWACDDCIVQFNEVYRSNTPSVDGGCYDIDYFTRNNIYQYNYCHDSYGYCMSIFGAGGATTVNPVLRYNICANNARDQDLAKRQGTVFLSTWDGGSLDGVQIYNNTIIYNPAGDFPALKNRAKFTGVHPNLFKNNIIYSTVPSMADTKTDLRMDHNLYWHTGAGEPKWTANGVAYSDLSSMRRATGLEAGGVFADPRLNRPTYHGVGRPVSPFLLLDDSPAVDAGSALEGMGQRDFFGNPIPHGDTYDIGAHEWSDGATVFHELFLAHFGKGLGLSSKIKLLNLSRDEAAQVRVFLRDDDGQPLTVNLNGVKVAGEYDLGIPASGLRVLMTDNLGPLVKGSVRVASDIPIIGTILFGGSLGLAGVGASRQFDSGFVAPVERNVAWDVNTGLALMNLEETGLQISLHLLDSDGSTLGAASIDLKGLGHSALFVNEIDWDSEVGLDDFQGVIEATANGRIAATVIQTEPGQLATLPVAAN